MRPPILAALRRQLDLLRCEVDLRPLKPADLASALTGEDQQSDDPIVIVQRTRSFPDCCQLVE